MDQPEEEATTELERAHFALHDASVLLDGDGTDGGVINRLYYAVFHAAQAVLYFRGINPGSHGHVRQAFGQSIVLEGDVSREEGELLGRMYDYRHQADYGRPPEEVDVDGLFEEVEEFVEHMVELIDHGK